MLTSDKLGNTGRFITVKRAFNKHLMAAVRDILPVTKNLEEFVQKPEKYRLMQADDRMVDKVEDIVSRYQGAANGGHAGLNAPLPVIIVAYAKDSTPADVTLGRGVYEPSTIHFVHESGQKYYYRMRTSHMENRVQVCFIGHDSETVRAMTSQMRLHLQGYLKRVFPIDWEFGGWSFQLSGTISDTDFLDTVVEIDERTNTSIVVWDFSIRFQMPYLTAPNGAEFDKNGKLEGFGTIKDTVISINHAPTIAQKANGIDACLMNRGYVDKDTQEPEGIDSGVWTMEISDIPEIEKELNNLPKNNQNMHVDNGSDE